MDPLVYAAVVETLKELTMLELALLNIVVQTDQDPHGRLFKYEKVETLFTECNGTKVHFETKDAISYYVSRYLHD